MTTTTATSQTTAPGAHRTARPFLRSMLARVVREIRGAMTIDDAYTADISAMASMPGDLSLGACHLMALACDDREQADRDTYTIGGAK